MGVIKPRDVSCMKILSDSFSAARRMSFKLYFFIILPFRIQIYMRYFSMFITFWEDTDSMSSNLIKDRGVALFSSKFKL